MIKKCLVRRAGAPNRPLINPHRHQAYTNHAKKSPVKLSSEFMAETALIQR
jgi:hypothetical protein